MNSKRKQRILGILILISCVGGAAAFTLMALKENLMYFRTPNQVNKGNFPQTKTFRVGGMVVENSLIRHTDHLKLEFTITDHIDNLIISYQGILPDLFREGQGIVAQGQMQADGKFHAFEVLAKHDETYMPPEIANMKKQINK